MEIAELRTGNLISNSKDQVCRVVYIDGRYEPHEICIQILNEDPITISETSVPRNERYHIDEIKPIMLTDDILSNIGFSKNVWVWIFKLPDSDTTIQLWSGNQQMSICRAGIAACHFPGQYVHQLQNLYFALTGEELNIKF